MRHAGWMILALAGLRATAQDRPDPWAREVRPLLARYCVSCHGPTRAEAKVDLDAFRDEAAALRDRRTWRRVLDALHSREMPPEGKPQPSAVERETLTDRIEALLRRPDPGGASDPGRPVVRRLTRYEYDRSAGDLLELNVGPLRAAKNVYEPGTTFPAAGLRIEISTADRIATGNPLVDLPFDEARDGFTSIGEVLTLPPFLMEKYLEAARQLVDLALAAPKTPRGRISIFDAPAGDRAARREAARRAVASFAARAWRRPVATAEVDALLALYDAADRPGEPYEKALRVPVEAVLVSPDFLYRVERESAAGGPSRLGGHELATRLSYFLWSTFPDAALLEQAGRLHEPAVLEPQVRRMLRDPRASALARSFAVQWLGLQGFMGFMPDPETFPGTDGPRGFPKREMFLQPLLFFETVRLEDRSLLEFLDADHTVANSSLAAFFGYPGTYPKDFRVWHRIKLPDGRRGGLLTMPAVLAVTSEPTRTSPVKRGKWILEAIFHRPPPPPVADAGTLPDAPDATTTLRRRLEQHRADPNCASCHRKMDPLGLGLENFDALGRWRDAEGALPIDASGTLSGGRAFRGPAELKRVLLERKDDFVRGLAEKMLIYAVGRSPEPNDEAALQEIVRSVSEGGYRFSSLILAVAKSRPFQYRRNGD